MHVAEAPLRTWWLRGGLAFLALLSVAPLLAWVCRLGEFSDWYWRLTVPALVVLVVASIVIARRTSLVDVHHALVAGTVGGLIGTIGYDIVRLPFLLGGYRLLAPIDSYGVLMLDAVGSSGRSGLAGWLFHTTNGVCFGIAYALVAAGRRWWWGVAWALVLETATVLTPFVGLYGLRQHPWLIVVAYLAHIPYGYALGRAVETPSATIDRLREITPRLGATALLAVAVIGLAVWQRPWTTSSRVAAGEAVAPGPSAVIHGSDRMSPQWVRVPVGGCAAIRNDTDHEVVFAGTSIATGEVRDVCFEHAAVKRVKIAGRDWSGGFVIVDPEQER
jgi:hypothetical protein